VAPPLYFFPKLETDVLRSGKALNRSKLVEYGLDTQFSDIKDGVKDVSIWNVPGKGPDGKSSGVLLTALPKGKAPKRVVYAPDFQRWRKVRNAPELWAGVDTEHPPTPADLARPRETRGYPVELADGNSYTVPIIRSPTMVTALPQEMTYDEDGEFTMSLCEEYAELWEATGKVWDGVYEPAADEEKRGLLYEECLAYCLRFLAINYRIGRYEQMVLRLLTTENCIEVLQSAVDFPQFMQMVEAESKKNAPTVAGTTNTEPGETAEPPATDPAEAS